MSNNGSDTAANALMTSLVGTNAFVLPNVDLTGGEFSSPAIGDDPFVALAKLTNADLTTGTIDGDGTFDTLMRGLGAQLQKEFDKGRITGADYAKTYIELAAGAMAQAVQFLTQRDLTYYQAVGAALQAQTAQVQLATARVQLEDAKAQLAAHRYEALNTEATFALTKLKLATEDANFGVTNYNLTTLLPAQKTLLDKQAAAAAEQTEAQRAQTSDTRTDGTAIKGVLGEQKLLYAQQIISYQRDAEVKAAKLFTDAWVTMKTIDEGVLPPNGFVNTSLDTILTALKTNNGFV